MIGIKTTIKALLLGLIAIGITLIPKGDEQMMKIKLDKKEYIITLENNSTTEKLKQLNIKGTMQDLHNNEKYLYLDTSLPTNEYSPKKIKKGDVMLFNDNCLVVFYKDFTTNYKYTKIGHINNLDDLNRDAVEIEMN